MTERMLDPRTANVDFAWDDLGDGCIGRVYYWYDPNRELPAIEDWDFRAMHPKISDPEWRRLFSEAAERNDEDFPIW